MNMYRNSSINSSTTSHSTNSKQSSSLSSSTSLSSHTSESSSAIVKTDDYQLSLNDNELPLIIEVNPVVSHVNESESISYANIALSEHITFLDGVALNMGTMIGSGIFTDTGSILRKTGSPFLSLVVWVLSGIFNGIGGNCYAELGTMIKQKSGGDYIYVYDAFGSCAGFIKLWIDVVFIGPIGLLRNAETFSNNFVIFFVDLDCKMNPTILKLSQVLVLVAAVSINMYHPKNTMMIIKLSMFLKISGLLLIILTSFVYLFIMDKGSEHNNKLFENIKGVDYDMMYAIYIGQFAYAGWTSLTYPVEEIQNSNITLPKAMNISILAVTVLYFFCNVAYFLIIPCQAIIDTDVIAKEFFQMIYKGNESAMHINIRLVSFFICISSGGAIVCSILVQSRIFHTAARLNQTPMLFDMLNAETMHPTPSILFMAFIPMFYICIDYQQYLRYTNIGEMAQWMSLLLAGVALLYYRYELPYAHRPYMVTIWFPLLFVTVSFIFIIYALIIEIRLSLNSFWLISIGLFVYVILHTANINQNPITRQYQTFVKSFQKILIVLPEDQFIEDNKVNKNR